MALPSPTARLLRRFVAPSVLTVALVATSAGSAPAAPGSAQSPKPPPLRPQTTNRYQALPMETFSVPTRGGDVYVELIRPKVPSAKRVPIILTYTPYAFLGETADDAVASEYVPRGYARALAHVVGTGNSGGCWDYGGPRETVSSYDLVEYLGTRSWSNGRVGMVGGSYDGTTANMAASTNPPHLTTIVPEVAISTWYGYAYFGGIRYFLMDPVQRQGLIIDEEGFDTPITFDLTGPTPGLSPSPDYVSHVPERVCPDVVLEHTRRGYNFEPDYDRFWLDRDYARRGSRLATRDGHEITMLVQGGWRDYNVKHSESVRMFESVPVDNPSTSRDEGVPYTMFVMGQGAHGAATPELHFDVILHAWFDHWLYGLNTNIEKQLPVISEGNDGAIRHDRSWPPPGTGSVRLYLRSGSRLSTTKPAGNEGSEALFDTGLTTESFALSVMGQPAGQAGVLWYVSNPLRHDLRLSGRPQLDLHVSTDETSTHFTPVLFDLGPPVSTTPSLCTFVPPQLACVISRGFLNARYRNGLGHGEDVVPGQRYVAPVDFIDNDWVVKAGHRIAVAVMSSNLWWALPNQVRATNTVFHDARDLSALVLPIVGGAAAARNAGL